MSKYKSYAMRNSQSKTSRIEELKNNNGCKRLIGLLESPNVVDITYSDALSKEDRALLSFDSSMITLTKLYKLLWGDKSVTAKSFSGLGYSYTIIDTGEIIADINTNLISVGVGAMIDIINSTAVSNGVKLILTSNDDAILDPIYILNHDLSMLQETLHSKILTLYPAVDSASAGVMLKGVSSWVDSDHRIELQCAMLDAKMSGYGRYRTDYLEFVADGDDWSIEVDGQLNSKDRMEIFVMIELARVANINGIPPIDVKVHTDGEIVKAKNTPLDYVRHFYMCEDAPASDIHAFCNALLQLADGQGDVGVQINDVKYRKMSISLEVENGKLTVRTTNHSRLIDDLTLKIESLMYYTEIFGHKMPITCFSVSSNTF